MVSKILSRILVCHGLLVLAACSIPDDARSGLRALGETGGLVRYETREFTSTAAKRVMFADPSQREEYALFKSGGAQSELMYITTRHYHITNVALENWDTLEDMIEDWNHNQNRNVSYDDAFDLNTDWANMQVKPFQLDSGNKTQCAGFNAEWEPPGDDSEQRPGKKLFGYYCEKPGVPMTKAQIVDRLSEIVIRGVNQEISEGFVLVPAVKAQPTQTELASRVEGDARSGTKKFPYIMAIFYQPNGGCDDLGC